MAYTPPTRPNLWQVPSPPTAGNKLPTHESLGDGPLVNLSRCHVRWYREEERCPREARGVCRGHCSAAGQESESSERSLLTKEMPFIQEPSEVELGALGLQLGRCGENTQFYSQQLFRVDPLTGAQETCLGGQRKQSTVPTEQGAKEGAALCTSSVEKDLKLWYLGLEWWLSG